MNNRSSTPFPCIISINIPWFAIATSNSLLSILMLNFSSFQTLAPPIRTASALFLPLTTILTGDKYNSSFPTSIYLYPIPAGCFPTSPLRLKKLPPFSLCLSRVIQAVARLAVPTSMSQNRTTHFSSLQIDYCAVYVLLSSAALCS